MPPSKVYSSGEGSQVINTSLSVLKPVLSAYDEEAGWQIASKVLLTIIFSLIIIVSVSGNTLVCIAVCTDRALRKLSNSLYFSLAVADLLLSLVVMTFAVANEMIGHWIFSSFFCNVFLSMDVMCCTASILNILAIAIDRYMHIQDPFTYAIRMKKTTFALIIAGIWLCSALISFIPIHLGWHKQSDTSHTLLTAVTTVHTPTLIKMPKSPPNTTVKKHSEPFQCIMDLSPIYAVVSSSISFFFPCLVMVMLYIRLYVFARKHVSQIRQQTNTELQNLSSSDNEVNKRPSTQDHKAAVTLGVIMGTFLFCWLPFFIINCVGSFCGCIPSQVFNVATWLGYFNSTLNPVIYSVFNVEFRDAFRKILCGGLCQSRAEDKFIFPKRTTNNMPNAFTRRLAAQKAAAEANQGTASIAMDGLGDSTVVDGTGTDGNALCTSPWERRTSADLAGKRRLLNGGVVI